LKGHTYLKKWLLFTQLSSGTIRLESCYAVFPQFTYANEETTPGFTIMYSLNSYKKTHTDSVLDLDTK